MRVHGIPQAVDRPKDGVDRRIEAQRIVRISQIVVNGPGDPDQFKAEFAAQKLSAVKGTVAADDDQPLDPPLFHLVRGLFPPLGSGEFGTARRL